jgi:hypothetical protein
MLDGHAGRREVGVFEGQSDVFQLAGKLVVPAEIFD